MVTCRWLGSEKAGGRGTEGGKMEGTLLFGLCFSILVLLTFARRKKYKISIIKWIPVTVGIAAMGLLGTYIMFYIENGEWYGQSFYGAVLFFPGLLMPVAVLFRISVWDLLDFATPAGLALLAPFKLNCYLGGCCGGKVLFYDEHGLPTHFPSQIVEMFIAVVLVCMLLLIEKLPKCKHRIYSICIITYGAIRFGLNFFRLEQNDFLFGLPAGNLWSIVSVVFGILLWVIIARKEKCDVGQ